MFTGLIEEVGTVRSARAVSGRLLLGVNAPKLAHEIDIHDSLAVNGVCLTVIEKRGTVVSVEAVEETMRKTTLGDLRVASRVNLELAMKLGERMGGHLVQGHVDCVGTVRRIDTRPGSWMIAIEFPAHFARYLVPVGSVAVDGVSLTVASLETNAFVVSIIPFTWENTTFALLGVGSRVNIEFDLVGKYVESMLKSRAGGEGITEGKMREWGY